MPSREAYIKRIFEEPTIFGTTLLAVCLDEYGTACMDFEPDTLRQDLRGSFGVIVPQNNFDKLQALITALTTNLFYNSLEMFINVCNSLDGHGADFQTFDLADVDEMAWSVSEVLLNDSPVGDGKELFNDEIRRYIGMKAVEEGFLELPKPLDTFGILPETVNSPDDTLASEDPAIYAAYWSTRKEQVAVIEQEVRQKMFLLVKQLDVLPLRNRDQSSWGKFAGKVLEAKATQGR